MPVGPCPKTKCRGCGGVIEAGQMRFQHSEDWIPGRAMCSLPCADTDAVKTPDGRSVWVPVHPALGLVMGRRVSAEGRPG